MRVLFILTACVAMAAPAVKFNKVPLSFEPNGDQATPEVRYLARGTAYTLYLTNAESVLAAPNRSPLRTKFVGSDAAARIVGEVPQASTSNYFVGKDPGKWRTSVANYANVRYAGIYPGIDLVYYGNDGGLEYDWIVSPGADPRQIRLNFEGADRLRIDERGDLVLSVGKDEYRHRKPVVYQEIGGKRVQVAGMWTLHGREGSFRVGTYDRGRPLVIDPALIYSTYHGGSGLDFAYAVAVDDFGYTYVAGTAGSTNFPTTSPLQSSLRGASDVFVTKFSPNGSARIYSTYLGSGGPDEGKGIALDNQGNVYVTGSAGSFDFPMVGAVQGTWGGSGDAFLTKINPAGSALVYSTYLGGNGVDYGTGVAVDAGGGAYVVGVTFSTNFPTVNPFQAAKGLQQDAFVAKMNPGGTAWTYATYLGGNAVDEGYAIAADTAGNAYVTGYTGSTNFPMQSPLRSSNLASVDAFVTKLNPVGSALVFSTYLGGSGTDYGTAIAVDSSGSAYVTGVVGSNDFPLVNAMQPRFGGADDAFVTKFNSSGTALVYSTYLGGGSVDDAYALAIDQAGNAYVTGRTNSSDFPLTNALQSTRFAFDIFVTEISATGSARLFSTFFGGNGDDVGRGIAVDTVGNIHIAGHTTSTDFPVLNAIQAANGAGAVSQDAIVLLIGDSAPPPLVSVRKSHTGNFTQGQRGAIYTVTVSNAAGTSATSGTVMVLDFVPAGETLVSMAGTGWTCPTASGTCTRSDALAGGTSYPPITVAVDIAANAAASLTNFVEVSGVGSPFPNASDVTTILPGCPITVSPLSAASAGTAGTLTLTLTGGACGWTATSNVSWLFPGSTAGTAGTLSVAIGANTTGAQRTGTIVVAGQTVTVTQAANNALQIPALISLNPFQGNGPNAVLTFVYAHPSGWAAIQSAEFIINPRWESTTRAGGCYVKYAPGTGNFTLIGDNGVSVAGTTAPGGNSISNSQCTLNAAASTVTGNNTTLTVVASLTFSAGFSGQRHIWMQAVDYNNLSTNWLVYGVWFPAQTTVSATPWYRIYDPFSKSYLYSADQNEYNTLGAEGFTLQGTSGLVMNGATTVGGVSNIAWYRVFVNVTSSHLWTSDRNEFLTLVNAQNAYVGEGVAAFVMPYINATGQVSPQVTNTIPFYRAAFQGANLHFWTSDANEFFGTAGEHLPAGYVGEGIACYIFPASGALFNGAPTPQTEADDGAPSVVSVSNGASFVRSGVIAPGQVLTVHGRHLGGTVLLNGVAAQVVAAEDNKIHVLAPADLAGASEVSVEVAHRGRRTKPVKLDVVPADPAIFGSNSYGRGNAQASNDDGTVNGPDHAAARGSVVTLYTTGYDADTLPVEVHIGGQPAPVLAAQVSGSRPGVIEVRVRVPETVPPAAFQPVVLHVGDLFSQPGVSLAIR